MLSPRLPDLSRQLNLVDEDKESPLPLHTLTEIGGEANRVLEALKSLLIQGNLDDVRRPDAALGFCLSPECLQLDLATVIPVLWPLRSMSPVPSEIATSRARVSVFT